MTLAALLILVALVVGVGREAVKEVERFHQPIEQWLSTQTGLQVRFSRVDGEWTRASPELHFSQLVVSDPLSVNSRPLLADLFSVRVSLGTSLVSGAPRLKVKLEGADVRLERCDDAFCLMGRRLQSKTTSAPQNPFAFLLAKPRLSILHSRVVVDGLYEQPTEASISELKLVWDHERALLDGNARLHGPDDMQVTLKGALDVSPRNGGNVHGVTYLKLSQGLLPKWIPASLSDTIPLHLQGAQGDTELWLTWFDNALASSTLRFDLHDVALFPDRDQRQVVDRVAGIAHWQGQINDFWQLGLRDLTIEYGQIKWRPAKLQLNAVHDANENRWNYSLALEDFSFDSGLRPVLDLVPENSLREILQTLQPTGRLQDVYVKIQHDPQGWALVQAQGLLREYSQHPMKWIPGLNNAGGGFLLEGKQVWLDFDEKALTLDYPAIFREPLQLNRVQGSLGIRWGDDGIFVRSSPLLVDTPYGETVTRMSLALPSESTGIAPSLALQSTLRNVAAEHASLYLPAGILSPSLLGWLDGAIQGGRLKQGDIIVNGPLHRPDQDGARSVLLGFQVEAGKLQFLPEWKEPIQQLDADVIVENGVVQATAKAGEYYGLSLENSRVWTQREGDITHLHVTTEAAGEAGKCLNLLRESPLGETLRAPLGDMTITGPVSAQFQLDAPLTTKPVLQGQVNVSLPGGELNWPSQRLNVSSLDLNLVYDLQRGLNSKKLAGNLLGRRVSGRLYQQTDQRERIVRLDLQGTAQMDSLRQWLDIPQLSLAKGTAPYALHLQLRPVSSRNASGFFVTSSLNGVEFDLPSPFGKTAAETREFMFQQQWQADLRSSRIEYADAGTVVWELQNGRFQRGAVRLGSGEPRYSARSPWALTGALNAFRWEEWAPFIERMRSSQNSMASDEGLAGLKAFGDSSLTVAHINVDDTDFGPLQFTTSADVNMVTVGVSGERLRGQIGLPLTYLSAPGKRSAETPVAVYVQKLVLPVPSDQEAAPVIKEADSLPPPASIDPRLLPNTHLRIDQLSIGDTDMGRYSATLQATSAGVKSDDLRFGLRQVDFSGNLQWEQHDGQALTRFTGKGMAKNAADVLAEWGYTPSLDSESAMLTGDVQWVGAPYQFKLARTQGQIQAHITNGHFLKVSNNAAGRVWGLLNFQTWLSRLQLRFSDLSDSDMPFKDIHGQFGLANNSVQVDRLRIDSPALKMKMEGVVDLREENLDMQWHVTVPVTRNLMLPAAMVGGLPGAATAYVLDKVLASQLDKLTTLTYDVTGTFEEPKVTLRTPLN